MSGVDGMGLIEHTDDEGHRVVWYEGRLSVYGKPSMTADDGTVAVGVDWPDPPFAQGAVEALRGVLSGRVIRDETEDGTPILLDLSTDPATPIRFDRLGGQ